MTNREKVLSLLQSVSPKSLTNSEISTRTGITPHQQVFQITQELIENEHIKSSRDGHEWNFYVADRTPAIPSSAAAPSFVQNADGLRRSSIKFLELENGNANEQKFFKGRIKNAKRFVALKDTDGSYSFVPGAYAAYSDRITLEQWQSLGSKLYRGQGRMHLDHMLGHSKVDIGQPFYEELSDAYVQFCAVRDITPSVHEDPLSFWLVRPDTNFLDETTQTAEGETSWEKTAARIIKTVIDTTSNANGQTVERILKNKDTFLNKQEFMIYLNELKVAQDGRCAITGIPMQWDGEANDPQLLCSLDRIDSNGHYERNNLQLVCRFINFWKNNSDNTEFKRLIDIVRTQRL